MLSHEQVKKFQELYKQRFGKELSYQEAYDKGLRLIQLVRLVINKPGAAGSVRKEPNR